MADSSVAAEAADLISGALDIGALHIEQHLDYARMAVYNNHLLSEALGLYAAGVLLPRADRAVKWRDLGFKLLAEEADRQFYSDGGYIQQSHNYHRLAVQNYLWANVFRRAEGGDIPAAWRGALHRSVDFLWAHQNPGDGRLPNFGANDGALPAILSSCDFSDMRPTLQAASILATGERLYAPGPWDEEAAWFLGSASLNAPLRTTRRKSISFADTGYHVLRGDDESTFAAFRCGTLRDRFSQIDMLHLDVWWKGENVLADPGSFRYNAAPAWHAHFMGTAAHNTVTVDGHNQMVHFRQFKVLYWTKARLLRFDDNAAWTLAEGEHYGYRRLPGRCVHRRAVLHVKDGLWVVCDEVTGSGSHEARVHWLGGDYAWTEPATKNGMTLTTPQGPFDVRLFDEAGGPLASDVVAGGDNPHRGWLSRYYGEKIAVPSLAAVRTGETPLTCISVLSGGPAGVACVDGVWTIQTASNRLSFRLDKARFMDVQIHP